jgi:acyl-lipid omega-6 desaturase (Delta-12 desaturase)
MHVTLSAPSTADAATPAAPPPASLVHLKASDASGAGVAGMAVLWTAAGIGLSTRAGTAPWLLGQVLLGFGMLQWFAILHEAGHETLFRTRWINRWAGRAAAFFALIPFHCWKRVHGRHHKWTGWQDVDPTTAALVPRPLGAAERLLMNVCWKLWIPLFALLYRLNNFWNVPRLLELFPKATERRAVLGSLAGLALTYALMLAAFGPGALLRVAGLAIVLAFVAEDVVLLSQHTHVPQQLSHGEPVRPFPAIEQEVFTRSLVLPRWLGAALLRIDAHELHHMYPFVPGYRLGEIPYTTENEIDWWTWTRRARALPGEVFLFQNRLETGADI